MTGDNTIVQISFPDTAEQGFEIVVGTRADQYLAAHPNASEADAYRSARASLKSAATALKIDAVVNGTPRHLRAIAALPSDEQMAMGNHAIALEFIDLDSEQPIAFDDSEISSWVTDCSAELSDAVYAYFRAQM